MSLPNLRAINWNQIYCFFEVSKFSSMKRAAKKLGVSVPSISEQIRRLEKSLDLRLFERVGRGIKLTEEGRSLFNYCEEMFTAGHKILGLVSEDMMGGQTVRVGIPETSLLIAVNFVSRYWDAFAAFGTVTTIRELTSERLLERLYRDEVDWAILLTKPNTTSIQYIEIGEFEVAFCTSRLLFERFRSPKLLIKTLPFIRTKWDIELNEMVDFRFMDAGVYPQEIVKSDHREFCYNLMQRGRAIGTLSTQTINLLNEYQNIVGFHLGNPIKIKVYAAWNKVKERSLMIRKLHTLIGSKQPLANVDPELQIKVAEIPESWLR